jgi:cell wall-associated NlpC family hydrolase
VSYARVRSGPHFGGWTIGVCASVAVGLVLSMAAPAGALPPPPDNPSDQQISDSQRQAAEINTAVGQLSAQVASTQGEIDRLQNDMELKNELAQKASIDLDVAVADAQSAADAATVAAAAAAASQTDIDHAKLKADSFAAASFRQGSQLGSMSALFGSGSATEMLQRDQLLDAISGSQLDVMGGLQRARVNKANLDAAARDALAVAQQKQAAADAAKKVADQAAADAKNALQVGQSQLKTLQGRLLNQQVAYQAAVNTVTALQGQRQAYNDWLVLKAAEEERLRREAEEAARRAAAEEAARQAAAAAAAAAEAARVAAEQEAARQAAAAAAAAQAAAQRQAARDAQAAAAAAAAKPVRSGNSGTPSAPPPPSNAAFNGDIGQTVVAAAKRWLGTTYVWGGGNANGPTGGGFDCSGLVLYAYAQVGIALPHYSGYQYYKGARISKGNLKPGDLVFYAYDTSNPATIHHVAMYIGNNQMIEAPFTGSWVRIMPLRTSDYIGASRPYA